MSAVSVDPEPKSSAIRMVWQLLLAIAMAAIGYEAIRFWVRDPLHYIVDQTAQSFGSFWPRRWWLLLHIGGGTLALFMGPFQFWSGLRRRHLNVHRITGLLYLLGVFVGGFAAFYMSQFTTPADFGFAVKGLSVAWWVTVGMAYYCIKQGRIDAHKEWMIRGYVVTLAFVTFRYLIDLPLWKPFAPADQTTVMWLCWSVPLLITEVVLELRRGMRRLSHAG
jgi:uncharacterized membrane protein